MILASLLALVACRENVEKVQAIDLTDLDTTVTPGENFYKYANGGWQVKNPLKGEYSRYGSFDKLGEDNITRVNDLFQEMAKKSYKMGTVEQKISDLYKQGLDTTTRNAQGAEPLKPYLEKIYSAQDKEEFLQALVWLRLHNEGYFFDAGVAEDMMDSDSQILYVSQCGLGMGQKEYYTKPENAALKEGYKKMLEKFMSLAQVQNPEKVAANALAVEDKIANLCWNNVQLRDYSKQYNPMSSSEFCKKYSGINFQAFFDGYDIPEQEKIIVMQPDFFEGICKLYEEEDLTALKDYVAASFVCGMANALSEEFYTTRFEFYSAQMQGIKEQRPLWKRAMSAPNGILGEAVGQMYVKKYFPESSKVKVLKIVDDLKVALSEHIAALDWMTDSTKAYAQEKLAAFTVKIGYPDKWKDYSSLNIDPNASYMENFIAAGVWFMNDNISKLGKPTDRSEWAMSPQTVNAYYNPTSNEICFPAAILQPPFFNADADDAVNYGAIGVVIGHEMTHGFDDQGRNFDKKGNMNNWWTDEDAKAFQAKTAVLVKQYSEIEVQPGLFANGELSLGENIADQGGVGLAYTALMNSYKGNIPAPIDGFTAQQRFFLGFAHVWAGNITDEEVAHRTMADVHSLSINRVNATLRNFKEFFDAFSIKEGDKMWLPEDQRVMIW